MMGLPMKRGNLELVSPAEPEGAPASPAERLVPPSHEFVLRLRVGDPEALTLLYRMYQGPLRALARRLLDDALEAEDIVHDVFLAVPRALRGYAGDLPLESFLCGMVVNLSRRRLRSFGRFRRAVAKLFDGRPATASLPSTHGALEHRELAARLRKALDQLPFAQRVVVVLCLVEERTDTEVSAILGVPAATVRTRLFHGRRKLQALLGEAE